MDEVLTGNWVELRRRDDVLSVTFRGLYHFAAHLHLLSLVRAHLAIRPARALVVDLSGAVILLNDEAHAAIVESAMASAPRVKTPTAVVITAHAFATTTSLCARLWVEGFYWVPFLRLADAEDWAHHRRPEA